MDWFIVIFLLIIVMVAIVETRKRRKNRKNSIRDFSIEGEAKDGETIIRIRKEVEDNVLEDMRSKGYVPIIDLLPQLFWEYNKDTSNFTYEITIYGTFVGKVKSRQILGVLDSRFLLFENEDED